MFIFEKKIELLGQKKVLSLLFVTTAFFGVMNPSFGVSITDPEYNPYYEYELRFTNPKCKTYYGTDKNGRRVKKPKNIYCSPSDKKKLNPDSPQAKIIELIEDPNTYELFLTYLSFSDSRIANRLCKALDETTLKVTLVLDRNTKKKVADKLKKCGKRNQIRIYYRGHDAIKGEGNIGYAHNKLILVNPSDEEKVTVVFSSGNLSSGTTLHHENWHFVTSHAETHFVQAHLCLKEGVLNHYRSKKEYTDFIKECREEIDWEEEDDIKIFFVPGEGYEAFKAVKKAARRSYQIDMAAHRFSHKGIMRVLREERQLGGKFRLVLDDDLYLAGHGFDVGPNMSSEFWWVDTYLNLNSREVRYLETNHNARLLHHNKFMIFHGGGAGDQDALFCGAGNFTKAAFTTNFENFYFITIPEVTDAFKEQFEYLFSSGTKAKDL
jgi:hypothetical protein